MSRQLRRFLSDNSGTATMEFLIVLPLLMWVLLTVFETGFIATRVVLLEHGIDIASRDLRLGLDPTVDHARFKKRACENSKIIADCERDLILEVVELDPASPYPKNQANCRDRSGEIMPSMASQDSITLTEVEGRWQPHLLNVGLGSQRWRSELVTRPRFVKMIPHTFRNPANICPGAA